MPDIMIVFAIRNILLVNLCAFALADLHAYPVRGDFFSIRKTLKPSDPLTSKRMKGGNASNRFWEIDMTEFEP